MVNSEEKPSEGLQFNRRVFMEAAAKAAAFVRGRGKNPCSNIPENGYDGTDSIEMKAFLDDIENPDPKDEYSRIILNNTGCHLNSLAGAVIEFNPENSESVDRFTQSLGRFMATHILPSYQFNKKRYEEDLADPERKQLALEAYANGFPFLREFLQESVETYVKSDSPEKMEALKRIAEGLIDKLAPVVAIVESQEKTATFVERTRSAYQPGTVNCPDRF